MPLYQLSRVIISHCVVPHIESIETRLNWVNHSYLFLFYLKGFCRTPKAAARSSPSSLRADIYKRTSTRCASTRQRLQDSAICRLLFVGGPIPESSHWSRRLTFPAVYSAAQQSLCFWVEQLPGLRAGSLPPRVGYAGPIGREGISLLYKAVCPDSIIQLKSVLRAFCNCSAESLSLIA